ncbi:MAG: acriflavin resistance protein, partial [Lachnospiraceae bacterium]|nr:acriflavin resistance protein [Lachnospiraceae bacterium]
VLNDNAKVMEDNKQKLHDGNNEIAENKAKLVLEGKSELANKKSETTAQLAAAETKILTAKADLEATKMHLTLEIATSKATIEAAQKGIDQITEGMEKYNEAKEAIAKIEDLVTRIDESGVPAETPIGYILPESQLEAISQLLQMDVSNMTVGMVKEALKATMVSMNAALEAMGGEEGYAALESQKAELETTVQMQTAAVSAMQSQLTTIENNISSLDKALEQLYAGNLTAAIEFANAQTTITVGEMQLNAAETQLEASEKQLEAGEEQLEAGREQIDSAWEQIKDGEEQLNDSAEQLKDALQQILDGEEELEEARENAYAQADMNDILTVDTVKSILAAQNFSMPAGYVTEEGIDYLVRVGDKPQDIEELKKMPLLNPEMDDVDVITLG